MIPLPLAGFAGKLIGLASKVPWWAWAMLILLLWGGCARRELKSVKKEFETAKVTAAAERVASETAAKVETERRERDKQEIVDGAKANAAKVRAAQVERDRAGNVAEQLRARLAAVEASRCAGDPAAGGGSEAAREAADLSAYVRRRIDEATDGVADFAEGAAGAGEACQRQYRSLSP